MRSPLTLVVGQRLWQGFAGLVTVAVITSTLNHEQQGWYYTFISIAALYSIFEMGLSAALLQLSAHMFVNLHWLDGGRVGGDGSDRFQSFLSSSARMYLFMALLFVVLAFLVGNHLFSQRQSPGMSILMWMGPWVALILLTGANMMTLPFLAIVEGTGEVSEVYKVRLVQGVLGALLTWVALSSGAWLWAAVMMPFAGFLVVCCWLLFRRVGLIWTVIRTLSGDEFDWLSNIWPHQWRLGLHWVCVFFMSQLATPILFYYQDPVAAGRMGLSLTVAHMLGIIAQSWIARHVPMMSQAVARREWLVLDHIFRRDFIQSVLVFLLGAMALVIIFLLLMDTPYISRLLPFWEFVGLLVFVFFYHINGALSAQLRSFRREPLVWVSVVGALLILPGSILQAHSTSSGVVLVMLVVQSLVVFPLSLILWRHYNRLWRGG